MSTTDYDILVVDDSRIVRAMVSDVLRAEGYHVAEAEDGRQALARVSTARPDLILLDVMMPEVDGYEVCRALREEEREEDYIPILMLTAKGEVEDLARGLAVGADDYIAKPFDNLELLARVKSLLRIRSLQKRLYLQNLELEAKNQQLEALTRQLDAANQELMLLSVTDGLTRAYNHRHFQERLKGEYARARRHGEPFTCVMIDLDHFKRINDTYGHPVGDRVLVRLVEILKEGVRSEDLVARYGGEEFVLLLPKTDSAQARVIADRLRERIAREEIPVTDSKRLAVTVSMGVADFCPGAVERDPDALLRAADEALYRAKANGRNRVEVA